MANIDSTGRAAVALPPIRRGFEVDDVDLPERTDVPLERRERAAEFVTGIACGCHPEQLVDGIPDRVREVHAEPLQRREALAHLDLILSIIDPTS